MKSFTIEVTEEVYSVLKGAAFISAASQKKPVLESHLIEDILEQWAEDNAMQVEMVLTNMTEFKEGV